MKIKLNAVEPMDLKDVLYEYLILRYIPEMPDLTKLKSNDLYTEISFYSNIEIEMDSRS